MTEYLPGGSEIPLKEWANINPSGTDRELHYIYYIEQKISFVSKNLKVIRNLITRFEICHFKCERHIQRIIEAIGTMNPGLNPESIGYTHPKTGNNNWFKERTGRSRLGQEYIRILEMWLFGEKYSDDFAIDVPQSLLHRVFDNLGIRNEIKLALVEALIDRLLWNFEKGSTKLLSEFEELRLQIDRTDICHYSFPVNLEKTILAIGNLSPSPDFEGCGSYDPERIVLAERYFHSLKSWLKGNETELCSELGDRDTAKEWLVACLAKTLKAQIQLEESMF